MDSGETSPQPDIGLPDADKGSRITTIQHIRDVFYRMGFNDQDIVALLGAHAMGRCHTTRYVDFIFNSLCSDRRFTFGHSYLLAGTHAFCIFPDIPSAPKYTSPPSRSGYWGPWTNSENSFSNEYFRLLLEERWSPKTTHNGKPWTGPDQFEDRTGNLMMLPSDIALIADPAFKKWVEIYANDEDRFFRDYAKAFSKLLELGVPFPSNKAWYQFW